MWRWNICYVRCSYRSTWFSIHLKHAIIYWLVHFFSLNRSIRTIVAGLVVFQSLIPRSHSTLFFCVPYTYRALDHFIAYYTTIQCIQLNQMKLFSFHFGIMRWCFCNFRRFGFVGSRSLINQFNCNFVLKLEIIEVSSDRAFSRWMISCTQPHAPTRNMINWRSDCASY